jgi:hypothetical protein
MKTYSEVNGKEPFDWYKALKAENISEEDWDKLEKMSNDWVTCACGNQCTVLERENDGRPRDLILYFLGGKDGFTKAIIENNKEEALNLLNLIELRSQFLINQIKSCL